MLKKGSTLGVKPMIISDSSIVSMPPAEFEVVFDAPSAVINGWWLPEMSGGQSPVVAQLGRGRHRGTTPTDYTND